MLLGEPIPDRITRVRIALGLSRAKFGKLLSVSDQTIMRWEKGDSLPSEEQFSWIIRMEEALDKAKSKNTDIKNLIKKSLVMGGAALAMYHLLKLLFGDLKDE